MAEVESIKSDVLPYDFVKENEVIVSETTNGYVATSPYELTLDIYKEIQRYLNSDFEFKQCSTEKFNEILTSSFSSTNHNTNLSEELSDEFDLKDFAGSINATEDLLSGNNDAPIIKLINGIISQAIKSRASDIHFEPYENHIKIRFRVDGILKEILKQDSKIASILISRIKIISGLDISERRLPQDGRVSLSLGDKNVDVRVSTLPSSYGERIVLRLLDKQSAQINIDDLGLPSEILSNYKTSLKDPEGIILFTGPTGSGKTTTLYAGLRYLSDSSQNILTVEDPIEYTLDGIGQTQVNPKTGYTFAKGLRAILRQDPDVVMV
jgi:general secretion pathway protein E